MSTRYTIPGKKPVQRHWVTLHGPAYQRLRSLARMRKVTLTDALNEIVLRFRTPADSVPDADVAELNRAAARERGEPSYANGLPRKK